jgi:replicative DNA helicase Mcm
MEEQVFVVSKANEQLLDVASSIEDFLHNFKLDGKSKYRELIRRMILEGRYDVEIDFNDVMSYNPKLAEVVIKNPEYMLKQFSEVLRKIVEYEAPDYAERVYEIIPRFRNLPLIFKIRDLRSHLLNNLIAVEGIVVRASPPKQKIVEAVFQHDCGNEVKVPVAGDTVEKPLQCPYCHKSSGNWRLVEEKSRFRDFQRLVIQEKPEEMPAGRMPRSIEADIYDNLVDMARPGDRVVVIGVLKLRGDGGKRLKSLHDMYIETNNIMVSQRILEEIEITKEDEENIKELAKDPLIRRKIIASIAPAIHGLWDIKEAIALLLFGGVPKVLPDGTKIRGDIHVLIIGDPGTAKSQLLQYVARIAPRAVYTTGKGLRLQVLRLLWLGISKLVNIILRQEPSF